MRIQLLGLLLLPGVLSAAQSARVFPSLVTSGLIGHWKFDGDGNDSGPRKAHGEVRGQAAFPDTSLGGRNLRLNGRDTVIAVPADNAPSIGHGGFSISLWVQPRGAGERTIVSQLDNTGAGWRLRQTKDLGIEFESQGSRPGQQSNMRSPANVLANGRWGHVVISVNRTTDGGFARMYVNARHLGDGKILEFDMDRADLLIGAEGEKFFTGQLDEFYLFERPISEFKQLFAPGSRFDYDPLAKDKFGKPAELAGRVSQSKNPAQPHSLFPGGRFILEPNDVVALIGGGNLEAAQKHGHLETLLTSAYPNHKLRFRNVAWEGDTVFEQWRDVNFGAWPEQLAWLKAKVLFVQFGQMESLAGVGKLNEFIVAYEKLLDQFEKQTHRVVLVSPMPFELPPAKLAPDLRERNASVKAYTDAIRALAKKRKLLFVDLFQAVNSEASKSVSITRDGIHLLPEGHEKIARMIAEGIEVSASPGIVKLGLRELIVEKNQLWFDYWRPMNYAFAFGDRMHVAFGRGDPTLREELEILRPILETAEARVDAKAAGSGPLPPLPEGPKRPNSVIANLTPEEQIASFKLHPDLQANLFASEADGIVNPVQMRWDERGRLWVLCLPTYPQVDPGSKPDDFILVCEDTDGDGRADKFHRFAEGLYLPMGLELGHGGLYVGHGTELIHLKDTDGDGRADQKRIVLSGFGTGDSHQLINSLTWAPNGRLWFSQGHHVYSRVETPWGIERHLKAGLWRFHPHRLKADNFFEQSTAGANCWGVAFDEWGQVFHNTGDAYAAFYSVPGMIRTDHPRRTISLFTDSKNMCIEIVGTAHLPEEFQNTVMFAGYYNNSVPVYRTEPDGSGVKTARLPDLISSTRREFRPVDLRVGPDGGLYLCDWYNEIVGHYQASYRDPRRDKQHGRIWRITSRTRPLVRQPNLAGMNPTQLVRQLESNERWTRYQVKRLLLDQPTKAVVAACDSVVANLDPTKPADLQLLYRLTGVYEGQGLFRRDLMEKLLNAGDSRARCYGVRMIGNWADQIPDALELLERFVRDDNPRVRLESVVAATYVNSPRAMEIAIQVLNSQMDPFLDYAIRQAVHGLADRWKPAFTGGELTFGGRAAHMAFVLQEDGSKDIAGQLKTLAASAALDDEARINLLKLLANVGQPADLRHVLDQGKRYPELLEELAVVAGVRKLKPSGNLSADLLQLVAHDSAGVRAGAARLAGAWKVAALTGRIREFSGDTRQSESVQVAAIEALGQLEGIRAQDEIAALCDTASKPPIRLAALRALARINVRRATGPGAEMFRNVANESEMVQVLQPFLDQKDGVEHLARELTDAKLAADVAKLGLRVLAASGRDAPIFRQQLNTILGTQFATPKYLPELVATLASEAKLNGRAAPGQKVFQSPIVNCVACHKVNGQGGLQGPDLSAVGTGMTTELIIEAILWPKRQVKEGYLATTATTHDDEYHQGYKVRETATELVLRAAATGREVRIAKKDIAEMTEAGTLMPEGLTAGMTRPELVDLIAYLSSLGRR